VIHLNGVPTDGRDGATIAELLSALGVETQARGVAVALNGEVVPRGSWGERRVADGDRVEALTAMQGG
jgi:sulfur carrier protein